MVLLIELNLRSIKYIIKQYFSNQFYRFKLQKCFYGYSFIVKLDILC